MRVLDLSLVSHCNYVARVQSIYSGQDFDCHPFCICLTPCLSVLRHRQVLCRVNAVGKLMNKLSLPLIPLGKSNPLGAVPSVRAPLLRESKHHQLQIPSQTYFLFCAREFSYIFFWLHSPRRLPRLYPAIPSLRTRWSSGVRSLLVFWVWALHPHGVMKSGRSV